MAAGSMRTRVVSSSKDNLFQLRRRLPHFGDATLVANLAGAGKTLISQRTTSGVDAAGQPFRRYSTTPIYVSVDSRPPGYPKPSGGRPSKSGKSVYYAGGYAEYRAALGLGSKPTLSISNRMLTAIQIATMGSRVAVLYITGKQAAKAHGHHFGTTTTQREFFSLDGFQSIVALEREALKYLRESAARAKLTIA